MKSHILPHILTKQWDQFEIWHGLGVLEICNDFYEHCKNCMAQVVREFLEDFGEKTVVSVGSNKRQRLA